MNGDVITVDLSSVSAYYLSPVKGGFLDNLMGIVLDDSGYVSGHVA